MTKKLLIILLVGLLSGSAICDEESTVSLSLQRFLELTKTHQSQGEGPPLAAALGAGSYTVSADRDWAEVQAEVEVQTFRSGWNEIALLPSQVLVAEATLNGRPLPVYLKDGQYRFMLKGVGRHKLHLSYHLKVNDSGPSHQLKLVTPNTTASQVTLKLKHRKVHLSSSPAVPLRDAPRKTGTLKRGVLPAGRDVTFTWTPLEVHPELRGQATQQKPKVYARVYYLAVVTEKAVRSKVQVDYSILRNHLNRLEIAIPKGNEVVNVACPNLASWSVKDTPEERRLLVELTAPWSGHQSLNLVLERPIENIDSSWELPLVRVLGAERVKGSLGIGASPGIEVTQADIEEVRPIDVTQLPPLVTRQAANPLLLAYEYHQDPFRVKLKTSKGKELAVLTAAIDLAEATTLITKEGKIATVFVYNIRNNRKQSMSFELPEGSQIQNAYVNGKSVKPVVESQNKVRLPLVLSNSADASFTVQLTTLTESKALLPVASTQLKAPVVDIPISELVWQVFLPVDRDVWREAGTMQVSPQGVTALTGSLPVALLVPQVGKRLAFRQLMVAEEAATIELFHSTDLFKTGLWWLVLGGVLVLGSSLARKSSGWRPLLGCAVALFLIPSLLDLGLLKPLFGAAFMGTGLLGAVWVAVHRNGLWERLQASRARRQKRGLEDQAADQVAAEVETTESLELDAASAEDPSAEELEGEEQDP